MADFEKDPRVACKYGPNCYQKNPSHKLKYKHPPRENPDDESDLRHNAKKLKKDEADTKQSEEKTATADVSSTHNISESDDEPAEPTRDAQAVQKPAKNVEEPEKLSPQSDVESEQEDEDELPMSSTDVKSSIKQKFLVDMPEDFFSFWKFCESLSKDKPLEVLKDANLILAGPFDVLSGKINRSTEKKTLSRFLRHWRFYYDPPEFQTVLVCKDKNLYHIGYFRDDPKEMPCFLASNCASKDGTLVPMGPNIFSAVNVFLEERKKSTDPFSKIKLVKLQKSLQAWAEKEKHSLVTPSSEMKQRTRKTVCKTFHGAGLVVPVNKKSDIGYRPLIESNTKLKQILNKIQTSKSKQEREDAMEELQPIINAANIANDECDFGTSIELGLDLFFFGGQELGKEALLLLTTGYNLVNRKEFAEISKAHLKNRKRGGDVDMFP